MQADPGRPTSDPLYVDAALLAATLERSAGPDRGPRQFCRPRISRAARRVQALDALVAAGDDSLEATRSRELFAGVGDHPVELRGAALGSLWRRLDDALGGAGRAGQLSTARTRAAAPAIELLTERRAWAEQLLDAIGRRRFRPPR